MPVVMHADRQREIERALDLAEEFKLRAIIAGGADAATVADRLRERNVPVLLSLNLPKRMTAAAPEADPETLRTLRGRVEAQKTAAKLAAARVRFAFQSGALTNMGDFLANAAKAIENGLSRSEEHTSELQSLAYLVCRLLLEKKKKKNTSRQISCV